MIFFKLTVEPVPKVLGYVCIPTSLTFKPEYLLLIANSAPIKGLFDFNYIFLSIFFLISLDPVDISLKFVKNKTLNNAL